MNHGCDKTPPRSPGPSDIFLDLMRPRTGERYHVRHRSADAHGLLKQGKTLNLRIPRDRRCHTAGGRRRSRYADPGKPPEEQRYHRHALYILGEKDASNLERCYPTGEHHLGHYHT